MAPRGGSSSRTGSLLRGLYWAVGFSSFCVSLQASAAEPAEGSRIFASRLPTYPGLRTGLLARAQVAAGTPLGLFLGDRNTGGLVPDQHGPSVFRNLNLAANFRLVDNSPIKGFRLALTTTTALPTGSAAGVSTDVRHTVRPRLTVGLERGRLAGFINAGYNFRRRSDLSGQSQGGELAGGVALAYEILPQRMSLQGETYAAAAVQATDTGKHPVPIDGIVGLRWAIGYQWTLQAGLGVGLVSFGREPSGMRALTSLSYQPFRQSR